ncbi:hypothetical protein CEP53_011495 [Fusarium sp. AF-6]|nr:hypothetical protein CEP53_011495 [Fusarium sp. AF-6]
MPYPWKWIGLILACMVGSAHADPWDDFANNLFTDLAPLLALFGERATMQFMSQALGWEDCVILAMAPLGIITILVSAIRVGGPAWLKAVVGRARENISAAEMELMSSTSKEVCELNNGQTIVRCQGSTPVWEFIYLIPRDRSRNQKLEIKVVTLEEACKVDRKLLHKMDGVSHKGEVFFNSSLLITTDASIESGVESETVSEEPDNEAIYVLRNMGSDAPNIILNLKSHNGNRKELKVYAMVGVILQLCVLVFFGLITYHPTIKNNFRKDDQRVDDYAFPLAIIESSTREAHYKKDDNYEMRIVWIQQKQTVGDQVFEPLATFPDTPRDVVTMSRRCDTYQAQALEPLTIIGICIGLAGFIIQFIGLRGMNSAATLAQLGVVAIMTAIRAWVRRGLAIPPRQEKLTSGFELDALALAQFKGASAAEAVNLVTAMEKIMSVLFPLRLEDPEKAWAWPLTVVYGDSESEKSEYHVNISLTGKDGAWKVLADQLESVLSLCLFTAQKEEESRSKHRQAGFNFHDENDDWLRQKTMNSGLGIRLLGSTDAEKTDQLIQDLRWWAPETFDILAEIQEVVGFNDENTEVTDEGHGNQSELDREDGIDLDKEIREELDRIIKPDSRWDAIRVDGSRVVGYGPARRRPSRINNTEQRLFRNFSVLKDAERKEKRRGTLAIESNDPLEKLLAKDLLFSFLFSAAKTLPTALRTEVTTREATSSNSLKDTSRMSVTKELTPLAAEFGRLGYGTEKEAWLSIIAPLSITEKLPDPRFLLDLAKGRAEKFRQNHEWTAVTDIYLEPWKQTQRLPPRAEKIRGWATAFMVEHLRDLEAEKKRVRVEGERLPGSISEASDKCYSALRDSKHQPGFFAHLLRLYERQGRPIEMMPIQRLAGVASQDGSASQDSFPDYFGITELHSKAMDPKADVTTASKEVWNAIHERDILDWTPMHWAAATNNKGAFKELTKKDADPNSKSLNGFTPVHYLCQARYNPDEVDWEPGWKLDARGLDGATPMHIAAGSGNLEFIKANPHRGSILAMEEDQRREAMLSLRDYNGRLPIHWAVIHGHERVLHFLKNTVDEPDIHGWTSLHLAVLYHEPGSSMIRTVFQLSADREIADQQGRTPLILACSKSKPQAAHELIKLGADINSATPSGTTPLDYAIRFGEDAELVQALVNHGAKVDVTGKGGEGYPPLHSASKRGSSTIMKTLLAALSKLELEAPSAAINSKKSNGQTALHIAALHKRPGIMELLLAAGADPNSEDGGRRTPLHNVLKEPYDTKAVHLKLVKMLVENGANPQARDSLGETPLDMAVKRGHTDAEEYFKGLLEAEEPASI